MSTRPTKICDQWYFDFMYTHEKNKHTGVAHLKHYQSHQSTGFALLTPQEACKIIDPCMHRPGENLITTEAFGLYFQLTFTAKKLPSTSHAAKIKSWNLYQHVQRIGKTRWHRHPSRRTTLPHPLTPSFGKSDLLSVVRIYCTSHICIWCRGWI